MKLYLFENKALREVSHSQLKITWRCGLKALFLNIKLFRTKQVYSLISNNKAWHSVFSFYGLPEGISKGWFKICTVISNLVAQKILFHLRFYYENWIWHTILISQILFFDDLSSYSLLLSSRNYSFWCMSRDGCYVYR